MLVRFPIYRARNAIYQSDTQLFYKTGRLRVVVSTANLVDIDWRDIENVKQPQVPSCARSQFTFSADRLVTRCSDAPISDSA